MFFTLLYFFEKNIFLFFENQNILGGNCFSKKKKTKSQNLMFYGRKSFGNFEKTILEKNLQQKKKENSFFSKKQSSCLSDYSNI